MMREVAPPRLPGAIKEVSERASGAWPDLCADRPAAWASSGPRRACSMSSASAIVGRRHRQGRTAMPGASGFSCRDAPRLAGARDPVSIFYSGCATKRTASRSARIGGGGSSASAKSGSTKSPASARGESSIAAHISLGAHRRRAGLAEIDAVAGISRCCRKKVYDHFHEADKIGSCPPGPVRLETNCSSQPSQPPDALAHPRDSGGRGDILCLGRLRAMVLLRPVARLG